MNLASQNESKSHAKRPLLVADNAVDTSEIIAAVASELGFDVTCVHRGDEVVLRVSKLDLSVIILNLHLPGAEGVELLRELSQRGSPAQAPAPFFRAFLWFQSRLTSASRRSRYGVLPGLKPSFKRQTWQQTTTRPMPAAIAAHGHHRGMPRHSPLCASASVCSSR